MFFLRFNHFQFSLIYVLFSRKSTSPIEGRVKSEEHLVKKPNKGAHQVWIIVVYFEFLNLHKNYYLDWRMNENASAKQKANFENKSILNLKKKIESYNPI